MSRWSKGWPRLRNGKFVAGRQCARSDSAQGWVAVYPLTEATLRGDPVVRNETQGLGIRDRMDGTYAFRIIRFEIENEVIRKDRGISKEETTNRHVWYAATESELESRLAELGMTMDDLGNPWDVDYPL